MKKMVFHVLLLGLSLLFLSACSSNGASSPVKQSAEVPVVLNQAEYVLYQNVFYNNYMDDYDGKSAEKEGIFAVIQDGVQRCYPVLCMGISGSDLML